MKMMEKGVGKKLLKRQASVFSVEDNVTVLKIESIIMSNRVETVI